MAVLMTAGTAISAFAAPSFSVSDPFSVPNSLITAGGRANTSYVNARQQSARQEAQQQQQAAQETARQSTASTQPIADPDPEPAATQPQAAATQQTAQVTTAQDDTTPEANVLKVTPVTENVYYDEDKLYCEVYIINGFNRPVELTGKQTVTLYSGDTKIASGSGTISKPVVIQPGKYVTHMFVFSPGQFTPGVTLKDLDTEGSLSYAWADE